MVIARIPITLYNGNECNGCPCLDKNGCFGSPFCIAKMGKIKMKYIIRQGFERLIFIRPMTCKKRTQR